MKPPGGPTESEAYAGATQWERVDSGGTSFQWSMLGLPRRGADTAFIRDSGGNLLELRTTGPNYYYLTDGLGSVVAMTRDDGVVVNTYKYDPFGNIVGSTGTAWNAFKFAGAYFDSNGFYQLGLRWYDPATGRFTQRDPIEQPQPAAQTPTAMSPTTRRTISIRRERAYSVVRRSAALRGISHT